MRIEHIRSLENLGLFCHFSGLINIFLGLVVTFMKFIQEGFSGIAIGLFMFATGYSLVKISTKISGIILSEIDDSQGPPKTF